MTTVYLPTSEFASLPFPSDCESLTTRQEQAYEAARRVYISARIDYYLDNAKDVELDVWLYEDDSTPLLTFISEMRTDPVEAALGLQNAIIRIASKRATEDCDEMGYEELMRAI